MEAVVDWMFLAFSQPAVVLVPRWLGYAPPPSSRDLQIWGDLRLWVLNMLPFLINLFLASHCCQWSFIVHLCLLKNKTAPMLSIGCLYDLCAFLFRIVYSSCIIFQYYKTRNCFLFWFISTWRMLEAGASPWWW